MTDATPPVPLLGRGVVRHRRLRPQAHGFAYDTFFVLLPMRQWRRAPGGALARNRFGLVSFHDADHGHGGPDALAWLEALLAAEGIADADGEVWLHCLPRVLGYAFKPVSFWYCHRGDGTLAAVVVEVNNTFGERHCYLLAGPDLAYGREQRARKVFHVSPFCRVDGDYRFRFLRSEAGDAPRTVARIEHHDADGPLIVTSVSGRLVPVTRAALIAACVQVPLLTLGVLLRIHWQALRLALKRVPFFAKPVPPDRFVTR